MRLRALAFMLALCVGDYLLWDWSIAGSHDIVSLIAGLTLLPLAAVSVGTVLLKLLGLITHSAGSPSKVTTHSVRASGELYANEQGQSTGASRPESSSGRLAA